MWENQICTWQIGSKRKLGGWKQILDIQSHVLMLFCCVEEIKPLNMVLWDGAIICP